MRAGPVACLAVCLALWACQAEPSGGPKARQDTALAQRAATDGLAVLPQLVTQENYREMGFDAPGDAARAALGRPLPVYNVPLSALQRYGSTSKAADLLKASSQAVYPVTVDRAVRSSITVTNVDGRYQASSFGSAARIQRIAAYREGEGEDGEFIVNVPALNLFFLGRTTGGKPYLTNVSGDPRLKVPPGKTVPAEDVFQELAPMARAHNGQLG
jgi:hypothetical protein